MRIKETTGNYTYYYIEFIGEDLTKKQIFTIEDTDKKELQEAIQSIFSEELNKNGLRHFDYTARIVVKIATYCNKKYAKEQMSYRLYRISAEQAIKKFIKAIQ